MAEQIPRSRQQERARTQAQQQVNTQSSAAPEAQPGFARQPAAFTSEKSGKRMGLAVGKTEAVAGKGGERNLAIQWIDVWIGDSKPAKFVVTTLAGNMLEVRVEQKGYVKAYAGDSSLHTDVLPVVPIGTRGNLSARDTTTGETLEQPWLWGPIGKPSLWHRLLEMVKSALG